MKHDPFDDWWNETHPSEGDDLEDNDDKHDTE